jgi:uncharacterized protein YegP (UPF0339 family)
MSDNKRVKVWKDEAGEWRWTYWASSDRVATSGEGFKNRGHAVKQAQSLFPDAVLEVEPSDEVAK